MTGGEDAYRVQHEAFVSNLKGTSIGDIALVVLHGPVCVLLLKIFQNHQAAALSPSSFLREVVLLTFPMLWAMTLGADSLVISLAILGCIGALGVLDVMRTQQLRRERSVLPILGPRKPFLSNFKGCNMLLTCIAILAVDFQVFPRRYAKTETFGTGLMDLGVGSFVVSSALTSRYARGLLHTEARAEPSLDKPLSSKTYLHMRRAVTQLAPVFMLGVGRMVVVKLLNYQEHVSEYGVHWNFFVTLGAVWFVADVVHKAVRPVLIMPLAVVALVLYQLALSYTPLTDYIMSSPRDNFFSANREGFLSLIGYCPMYLISEGISRRLYWSTSAAASYQVAGVDAVANASMGGPSSNPHTARPILRQMLWRTCSLSVCLWILWGLCTILQRTSRRLANAPFVCLSVAFSFSVVALLLAIDWLLGSNRVELLERLNAHQLSVFLGANILTGLVNLSIPTIHVSAPYAMVILALYTMAFSAIAWHAQYISLGVNSLIVKFNAGK